MGRNALRRSAGKLLPVDIYERADQRYHVVWKDETGKKTARLRKVTGIPWRRNALRHSFCSYRVAITWNIPLVSIESGNSPQMIKSNYWDLKLPDEGFKWFGITLQIPAERRQEPFLMHLPLTSFSP
jgi:hypothetical protein